MDIISHAGAIPGGIVAAEHRQRRAATKRRVDRQRHQVGFGSMILPQPSLGIGTGGVEVTQAGMAHAVHLTGPVQCAFDDPLALAISGLGIDRRIRWDGGISGRIEQCGGRRQHEAADPVAHAGIDQADPVAGVFHEVAEWLAHRFPYLRQRREMEHRVPRALCQHRVDGGRIAEVGLDQLHVVGHGLVVADTEIVEHHGRIAPIAQRGDEMAADIAGTAGYQKATRHAVEILDRLRSRSGTAIVRRKQDSVIGVIR